jgi:hypothetical protein
VRLGVHLQLFEIRVDEFLATVRALGVISCVLSLSLSPSSPSPPHCASTWECCACNQVLPPFGPLLVRDISSLPPIYIYAIGKDIYARDPTPQEFSRTYDRSRFRRLDGQAVWLDGGARPRGVSLAVLALDLERGELWGWLGVRGPGTNSHFLGDGHFGVYC